MVVIVFIQDLGGLQNRHPPKKVSFVSYVHFKPKFFLSQIEPGEAIATTKEGKYLTPPHLRNITFPLIIVLSRRMGQQKENRGDQHQTNRDAGEEASGAGRRQSSGRFRTSGHHQHHRRHRNSRTPPNRGKQRREGVFLSTLRDFLASQVGRR